jgi:hypothetical protein
MDWMRTATRALGVIAVLVLIFIGYGTLSQSKLAKQVDELRREKEQLLEYARRLSASRRIAQVNVVDQYTDKFGRLNTRLVWQEIGANGLVSLPVEVETVGTLTYFEAFVIKFEYELVGQGDPERGTSLALFRRIFGDLQVPEEAPMLDCAGTLPVEAAQGPRTVEQQLWDRFWELVDDPLLAAQYGVRVAQCEAPAVPLRPGQIWQVTLDAPGGLNLKKVRDLGEVEDSIHESP